MQTALIVVDVQNDFITGSLRVPGGETVARHIATELIPNAQGAEYDFVVSTQDWHISPRHHFSPEPDFKDSWPVHCKAYSWGAELHESLKEVEFDFQVRKGHYEAAYSGFEGFGTNGWTLKTWLADQGVESIDIVGLALDYCVAATACDALALGIKTRILLHYTAPVSQAQGQATVRELAQAGVSFDPVITV